jgi:hypothetical protein
MPEWDVGHEIKMCLADHAFNKAFVVWQYLYLLPHNVSSPLCFKVWRLIFSQAFPHVVYGLVSIQFLNRLTYVTDVISKLE